MDSSPTIISRTAAKSGPSTPPPLADLLNSGTTPGQQTFSGKVTDIDVGRLMCEISEERLKKTAVDAKNILIKSVLSAAQDSLRL